jgi:predicted metalloprotease
MKRLRMFSEAPDVAIAGVCAHEFGHVVQFKNRLIGIVNAGQKTVKRSELQADYFAGYFAGWRKAERPNFPAAVIAFEQHKIGDTDFNDRSHHGTAEERGAAVVRGFEASYREKLSLGEAIAQSTTYVLNIE